MNPANMFTTPHKNTTKDVCSKVNNRFLPRYLVQGRVAASATAGTSFLPETPGKVPGGYLCAEPLAHAHRE